jgi:vitamin B12 transporter
LAVTPARRWSTRWGGFHYIAQNVGRANVRLDGARPRARPADTSRDALSETWNRGADRRARYRASMAVNRAFGCAWRLSRAHNDSGGTRRCVDGIVSLAARDDIAGSPVVVRARINNLLNKDDELAYAYNTPRRDARAAHGRQRR